MIHFNHYSQCDNTLDICYMFVKHVCMCGCVYVVSIMRPDNLSAQFLVAYFGWIELNA
jgi:hypothetical protein